MSEQRKRVNISQTCFGSGGSQSADKDIETDKKKLDQIFRMKQNCLNTRHDLNCGANNYCRQNWRDFGPWTLDLEPYSEYRK